jgi:membrane-associated phospholipid phosphatase
MEHDAVTLETAARWLGEHALPAFGVALLVLLLATALLWHLLHRWVVPPEPRTLLPGRYLFARLAIGFVVLAVGSWLFSGMAEALFGGRALGRADQALTDALAHSAAPLALEGFALVTLLGDPLPVALLCAGVGLVLWRRGQRGLALGWVAAVAGNALLNPLLKLVFARARPVHDPALAQVSGYGFPSGNAASAVVAYGMLAYVLMRTLPRRWHLPAALGAAAIAFTVGCSRVFLRVHYATDVLAGFATGLAWLAVCVTCIEFARHDRSPVEAVE